METYQSQTYLDFIRQICENTADDTVRLVFADWLEENGQEARGNFIRVQVELARRSGCDWKTKHVRAGYVDCKQWNELIGPGRVMTWCPACKRLAELRARERELWGYINEPGHANGVLRSYREMLPDWAALLDSDNGSGLTHNYPWAHVSRGFVSRITCTSADWLRHHKSLYWKPEQTEECRCRDEYGCWNSANCRYRCAEYPCDPHTGRIPRPMPPGAQPITDVVLTTWPTWTGRNNTFTNPQGSGFTDDRWPGIVFEVRPRQETIFRGVPIVWEDGVF